MLHQIVYYNTIYNITYPFTTKRKKKPEMGEIIERLWELSDSVESDNMYLFSEPFFKLMIWIIKLFTT